MSGSLSSRNEQLLISFQIKLIYALSLDTNQHSPQSNSHHIFMKQKNNFWCKFFIPAHHRLNFRILCQSKYDYLILFYNNVFRLLVNFIILNNPTVIYQNYIHLKWKTLVIFLWFGCICVKLCICISVNDTKKPSFSLIWFGFYFIYLTWVLFWILRLYTTYPRNNEVDGYKKQNELKQNMCIL